MISLSQKPVIYSLFAVVLLAAIAVRVWFLPFISRDYTYFILPWYNNLLENGYRALGTKFTDYSPLYTYLLYFVTFLEGILPKVANIKMISIIFDFISAFSVFKIFRILLPESNLPFVASSVILLLPTVVINSAAWAQCDMIYTSFLLISFRYIIEKRYSWAILYYSIAFAFKFHAIFFAPFLFWLWLRKEFPWYYMLLVPAVFLLAVLPTVALGRPFLEVVTIYLQQVGTYTQLSLSAPNFYVFISNEYSQFFTNAGIFFTVFISLLFGGLIYRSKLKIDKETIAFLVFFSVALSPYFLPKMHERYFFLADIFSVVLAFFNPVYIVAAISYQFISLMSYMPFLLQIKEFMPLPALMNSFLILWIFLQFIVKLYPQKAAVFKRILQPSFLLKGYLAVSIAMLIWIGILEMLSVDGVNILRLWPFERYELVGKYIYIAITLLVMCGIFGVCRLWEMKVNKRKENHV